VLIKFYEQSQRKIEDKDGCLMAWSVGFPPVSLFTSDVE
jgi:hypothetical protein